MPIQHERRPARYKRHNGQRRSRSVFQVLCSHTDQSTNLRVYSSYFEVVRVRPKPVCDNEPMTSFAVIDIETTGLDRRADRIVEIAVIQLDANLGEQSRWLSLVNPERPVGATHIHGLDDAALAGAPTFRDIAVQLANLLTGRVLVAHHAAFEQEFLNNEFARAGLNVALDAGSCVCTMDQSRIYLPPGSHSLHGVAARLGVAAGSHHRAIHDAETCARLLKAYVELENTGKRYIDSAINRDGTAVLPAQWRRAHSWQGDETRER